MLIANPIYDVFFKYMLEDNEIAREFIGTIIDEEIIELALQPQENTVQMKEFVFTVLRMDFHAVIKTKTGTKKVLIEMQKGKYFDDLRRFRNYLGERYSKDKDNYPIITIYFLGYPLDENLPAATYVKRDYYNRFTGQKLDVKNAFIESLSHDTYLIQIHLLKEGVKTKLEALLSIFDQTRIGSERFIISFPDTMLDLDILKKIVHRLQMAGVSEELRRKAEIENEIESSFKSMARQIQEKEEAIEQNKKALAEKDKTLAENKKALDEKDKTLEENRKAIEEKDRALEQSKRAMLDFAKILKKSGMSISEISQKTGLSQEELEREQ
ncbi:MAG: hypothetical protein H7A25_23355 [Leptospiraceae bacterium]|nr:hypothetical protein [Leptospiraceae bacterium]